MVAVSDGEIVRSVHAAYGHVLTVGGVGARRGTLEINRNHSARHVESTNQLDFHVKIKHVGMPEYVGLVITAEQALALVDLIEDAFAEGMELIEKQG